LFYGELETIQKIDKLEDEISYLEARIGELEYEITKAD
jgi:hypothetical protein